MKGLILSCLLLISFISHSQNKKWITVYYVLDSNGNEIAKRIDKDSSWNISNPSQTFEKLYQQKMEAERKYELALAILKTLSSNGIPIDKNKYLAAVKKYNELTK